MIYILLAVPPLMGALVVAVLAWNIRTFASTPESPVSVPEAARLVFFGYPHSMALLTLSVIMAVGAAVAVAVHAPEPIAPLLYAAATALQIATDIAIILERRAILRLGRRVDQRND